MNKYDADRVGRSEGYWDQVVVFTRQASAPFLFACAGILVISGVLCGSILWGNCPPVGLAMMVVAFALTLRGVQQNQSSSGTVLRGEYSRRLPFMLVGAL
jgi:hypothetical protein